MSQQLADNIFPVQNITMKYLIKIPHSLANRLQSVFSED